MCKSEGGYVYGLDELFQISTLPSVLAGFVTIFVIILQSLFLIIGWDHQVGIKILELC